MLTVASSKQEKTSTPVKQHPGCFFQSKLTINQPNDMYEQEADAMADKVMHMSNTSINNNNFFKPAVTPVQRKCAHCEEEEKQMQRKENDANEQTPDTTTENYINNLSGGKPLNKNEKHFFESRMGYDFSNVRLHIDNVAAKSAQAVNALAYTSGNNIVFNKGNYAPETSEGKRLMAHELTHVVQQNSGTIQPKLIQRDPPPASTTPPASTPALTTPPAPVPAAPPGPTPSLSMSGLTTFIFTYGGFSTRLSLPTSIQASLPVRLRNIGTLTFTATSDIPSQFGLSVRLDTINHIRISGNIAFNRDTGMGSAGISVQSMQQVCTMRDPDATRTRLNTLTNNVKTAAQAFDANNIQSIVALGSAIYSLYDAANDATQRCSMQPLWSIDFGARTPLAPPASGVPPPPGSEGSSSYIGITGTWHF